MISRRNESVLQSSKNSQKENWEINGSWLCHCTLDWFADTMNSFSLSAVSKWLPYWVGSMNGYNIAGTVKISHALMFIWYDLTNSMRVAHFKLVALLIPQLHLICFRGYGGFPNDSGCWLVGRTSHNSPIGTVPFETVRHVVIWISLGLASLLHRVAIYDQYKELCNQDLGSRARIFPLLQCLIMEHTMLANKEN